MSNDPVFPYSQEAEEAVLGAVIMGGLPALQTIQGAIGAGDFFLPRHTFIYEACEALNLIGCELDVITVSDKLKDMGKLANAGGDAYLCHLITSVETTHHIEVYASIVKKNAVRRAVLKIADDIKRGAMDGETDIEALLGGVMSKITTLELPTKTEGFKSFFEKFVYKRMDLWEHPTIEDGLSWGFPLFDKTFGLLQSGNLVGIAGQPKSRKSTFLARLTKNWLDMGKRVGFISLEMNNSEVLTRLEEMVSGVSFREARSKQDPMAWRKLLSAWEHIQKNWDFEVDDNYSTMDSIPRTLTAWQRLAGGMQLDVLVVDYAGLVDMPNAKSSEWEKQKVIIKFLKNLASQYGFIVVTAMQLNSDGWDETPTAKNIGGTIANAQTVNVMIGIYRPNEDDETRVNLVHMLNRDYGVGQVIPMIVRGMRMEILTFDEER